MPTRPLASPKLIVAAHALLALLFFAAPPRALAQSPQDDADRQRAFEVFNQQKFAESLPLLEKLAAKYPNDGAVMGRYGIALFVSSQTYADADKRKEILSRARAALVRAKELGLGEGLPADLIDNMIASVQPDGSEVRASKFSANREADQAMKEGEAAFARQDYDAALKAYARAEQLDSSLYEAPLFAGDANTQKGDFEAAFAAYARAARVDPDRETAYRYWGNVLDRRGRSDEARDKYIEAIIASPYDGYVWNNSLARWANAHGVRLGHPKIVPQSSVSLSKDNQPSVALDPGSLNKADGTSAWTLYAITRAGWSIDNGARFLKTYPSEKTYRHSLAEETEALLMVAESVRRQQKDGKIKQLDPALAQLVKLSDENLIAAYVLLARPDEGITQDYVAYRKAYRDKLRRYIVEYVIGGGQQ